MIRLGALAGILAVVLAGGVDAESLLITRSAYLMGTRADLSIRAPSRREGLRRLEGALQAIEAAERQLSTWRDDSQLGILNRTPLHEPWRADPATCDLLATVSDWQAATSGAFDPAVGPLIDAWDLRGTGRVPAAGVLARARASSGFRLLAFDRAACTVTRRAAVTIDAGAFGKGEALDRAARHLDGRPWMIDFGGQVAVGGNLPGSGGWRIALAHPNDRSLPALTLTLGYGSLATSGGSDRDRAADGVRIGHILDPRTGAPASFRGSVSVWHERALEADILSTALHVMGPAAGLPWAEARGLAVCYLDVEANGRLRTSMTPAFRSLLVAPESARGLRR